MTDPLEMDNTLSSLKKSFDKIKPLIRERFLRYSYLLLLEELLDNDGRMRSSDLRYDSGLDLLMKEALILGIFRRVSGGVYEPTPSYFEALRSPMSLLGFITD